MELTLIPTKQIFYNPENNYRVLSCIPVDYSRPVELNKYGNFTISGYNLINIALDNPVSLNVSLDMTSKYPASYTVDGYAGITVGDNITVDSNHEILLLQQIMTNAQAKNVHDAYPNFVEMVLNGRESEIDYKKIYNVAEVRFTEYCEKIKSNYNTFLFFDTVNKYNINDFNLASRFALTYASPELWEVDYKKNPYKMLKTHTDLSFTRMDKLVLSALPEFTESKERATYCVYKYLEENESEGDTKIHASILKEIMSEEYPELARFIVDVVMNDEYIHYDNANKYCGFLSTYLDEQNIANNIKNRVQQPYKDKMEWAQFRTVDGYEMTAEQNEICRIANDESIGMLVGPAGSGKTTATKALIKMLDSYGKSYILLAPTGIAAKKLKESTARQASTIHMAIARGDFQYAYDYVIIDEMSCVGVNLLSSVFTLIPATTKVIFICDAAQLASIACGNIVSDILNNNAVPTVRLNKIFRYGTSGIATIATNTRNGKIDGRGNTNFADNDYTYSDIDESDALHQVVDAYQSLMEEGYHQSDILILCPYNKSNLGTYTINQAIQEKFNNNTNSVVFEYKNRPVKTIEYKVGDRVINIHNNYHASKLEIIDGAYEEFGETPVMNGDIGVVRSIGYDINNQPYLDIQFDESMIRFHAKECSNLLLGYAISVHKSQGTQAKAIISVIGKKHKRMITRNLLYVADTRAQEKLIEIVDKDCVESGLEVVETVDRATWLDDMLS